LIFDKLGKVTEKDDGKIIKDENEEIIKVNPQTYNSLLEYSGGKCPLFILFLAMLCFTGCKIKTDYTIGQWANHPELEQ
jgi:hypothetical protein